MTVALSSLKISAELDASAYVAGAQQKATADAAMVTSGDKLTTSLTGTQTQVAATAQKLGTSTTAFERLQRSIDPTYASGQKFQSGQAAIQRQLDQGAISTQRATELTALLGERYNASNDSAGKASVSTGQFAFAVRDLGLQLGQVATTLSLGASPLTILEQQGVQIAGAFAAGGGVSNVVKGLGSTIAGLVTPTTLAIGGFAALAAGVILLIDRASSASAQINQFNLQLVSLGKAQAGAALEGVIEQLRETGSTAADATAAVKAVVAAANINPGAAAALTNVARDISAVTGGSFAQTATQLVGAFDKGTEAAISFAQSVGGPNALSAQLIENARQMDQSGDRAGALGLILSGFQAKYGGDFQKSLTASGSAIDSLSNSWNRMLDALSNTTAVQTAKTAIVDFLNGITTTVNNQALAQAPQGFGEITLPGMPTVAQTVAAINGTTGTSGILSQGDLTAIVSALIQTESGGNPNAVSSKGALGLGQLMPGTAAGLGVNPLDPAQNIAGTVAYLGQLLQQFGDLKTALEAYNLGPGKVSSLIKSGQAIPLGVQNYATQIMGAAGVSGNSLSLSPITVSANDNSIASNGISQQDIANLKAAQDQYGKLNAAARQFGDAEIYAQTYAEAFASSSLSGSARIYSAEQQAAQAVAQHNIQLQKQSTIQDETTKATLGTAAALQQNEVAGLQAAAKAQAQLEVQQGQATDVATRYKQILESQAAAAIQAAAQTLPGLLQQTQATQRLAAAAVQGTAAEHDAEIQNAATAATHDALAKAIASGNPALVAQAQAITAATLAQLKANDAAQTALTLQTTQNSNTNQVAQIQLEAQLQSQTSAEIGKQVQLLQAKQLLESKGVDLTSAEAANYLRSVSALGDANTALETAQANAERINDAFRSVADTVDSTLTQSIENAFSGTTVTNWATTVKTLLGQIAAQITEATFIKPLIGSIASTLGLGSVAQSYGTLGGAGGLGSLFGSGSSSASTIIVATPNANGQGVSFSNLTSAASLANTLSGGASAIGSSSVLGGSGLGSWLNQVGADSGLTFGGTPYAPALLGTTTATSLLGSPGAGIRCGRLHAALIAS